MMLLMMKSMKIAKVETLVAMSINSETIAIILMLNAPCKVLSSRVLR
jgi:hypothetical protein